MCGLLLRMHCVSSVLEENEVVEFLSSDFFDPLKVSLFLLLDLAKHADDSLLKFGAGGTGGSVHGLGFEDGFAEIGEVESERGA